MPLPDDQQEQKAYLLSQYLDGDLDEADRREVERMLAEDSQWALELERLKKVDELAKRWGEHVPELDWERFTQQALVSLRRRALITLLRVQQFERDLAVQLGIVSREHHTHPTGTELRQDHAWCSSIPRSLRHPGRPPRDAVLQAKAVPRSAALPEAHPSKVPDQDPPVPGPG